MAVQVAQPQKKQEKVTVAQKPASDLLDDIIKGLKIAAGITGITTDISKYQLLKQQAERDMQRLSMQEKQFGTEQEARETALAQSQKMIKGERDFNARIFSPEAQTYARNKELGEFVDTSSNLRPGVDPSSLVQFGVGGEGGGSSRFAFLPSRELLSNKERQMLALEERKTGAIEKTADAKIKAAKQTSVADAMKLAKEALNVEQLKAKPAIELRKERNKNKLTQNTMELRQSVEKMFNVENTPQGHMSLVFNYMKMLDPGSTVREGEYATAKNTGSIPMRVWNIYNQAVSGEMINKEQLSGFLSQSKRIFDGQLRTQEQFDKSLIESTRSITGKEFDAKKLFGDMSFSNDQIDLNLKRLGIQPKQGQSFLMESFKGQKNISVPGVDNAMASPQTEKVRSIRNMLQKSMNKGN